MRGMRDNNGKKSPSTGLKKRFSWDIIAEETSKIYEKVLKKD
jgi:glycogen synthase